MTKDLYKTTIVIWSDEDPTYRSLIRLAEEATDGNAFCSEQKIEFVSEPDNDPTFPDTEFFKEGDWD
jgi:hypothetical protein